ncbi:ABC transporter ATP-binding protein [Anaerobacillus sp. MEB173]|uniref:ABC transporter ATP-binding protein n=1 Tax=Anaerobacillus sp. MEB173 TaxID=3383345 RepID=UPI003F90C4F2
MEIGGITFAHDKKVVFKDFSLYIPEGEITCILGSSGVGKTTLLQMVAGIKKPQQGEIITTDNQVSYIFQEPRLLPWKTVLENVEFVLLDKLEKANRKKVAEEMLERVGLADCLHLFPHELSGGMRQRVSIARAFVVRPDILLLDEPLQGLDVMKRQEIQDLLVSLWETYQPTVLYITHDVEDALAVSHQILVFAGQPVNVTCSCFVDKPIKERSHYQSHMDALRTHLMLQMKMSNQAAMERMKKKQHMQQKMKMAKSL